MDALNCVVETPSERFPELRRRVTGRAGPPEFRTPGERSAPPTRPLAPLNRWEAGTCPHAGPRRCRRVPVPTRFVPPAGNSLLADGLRQ